MLRIIWQRKVVFLLTLIAVVALGAGSLRLQKTAYEATSTIAFTPSTSAKDPIFIISQVDVITPLYAEAVRTQDTKALARSLLRGRPLGEVNVRTFRGAPIMKVDVRSSSARDAQLGAQAVTDAAIQRATFAGVGIADLQLTQIDRPQLPDTPVSPRPKLTILISAILGLGLAAAAALLWDRIGRRVETADEVASVAGAPCYGEVPLDRNVDRLASAGDLVNDPRYRVIAEALRDIRTNLQFTEGAFRSILVTSPEGRHGKTFVSFGIAATLARSGARTLLVDGDLRRGRLAELLQIPRRPGLMEVLQGESALNAIQSSDLATLSVLPGGQLQDDPGELLDSAFFPTLYDLEASYDIVVIDAAPLVPVNDARLIARYVSAVLLVVSAGTLTRRQVRTAVERLEIIGVDVTAVVVNKSRTRRKASYYRYLKTADRP